MTAPDLTQLTADLDRLGPLVSFPWHQMQRKALALASDTLVILGGSRGGKSTSAMGIVSRLIRREGPIYRRLKAAHLRHPEVITDPDQRPLKIWVAPKTGEKAQSVWEPLLRNLAFKGMTFNYVQSPHRVFSWQDGQGGGEVWLKSQDQGLLAFESDDVDLVVFDEEPLDRRIVGAAQTRLTTTNGCLVHAFTPLNGLCLPGDTRITTGRGLVPLAEVVVGDRVAVRSRVSRVTAVHQNGVRPLLEIRTRRGFILRCTPEHEWLATSSIVRYGRRTPLIREAEKTQAQFLTADDWIAFNPGHPKFWPESPLKADDGYFLGQMVGDGSWRSHPTRPGPMKVTTNDPETRGFFQGYLSRHGVAVREYLKSGTTYSVEWCSLPFARQVESWGVERGQKTQTKRVPESVWRGSRDVVKGFLQGLFDSDGSADVKRSRVSWVTTSPELARDVMRLLMRFSVVGTLATRHDGHPAHAAQHILEITSANARRFMAHIGFRLSRKGNREWATAKNGLGSSWDRVVAVRLLNRTEPVYCLTVDDDAHMFAADGFVSGNSWTHGAYYAPCVRPEHQKGDRVWRIGNRLAVVQMGMADNPAAVAGGGVQRLRDDPTISEAERNTRLYGAYGYAEGLIFPVLAGLFTDQPDSLYLLDSLPRNRAYSWLLCCDPNKRHGGLIVALDQDGNRYAVAEHYAENLPDRLHAERYVSLRDALGLTEDQLGVYADPGGAGAQAILNLADCGLYAEAVPKGPGTVKANIEQIRRALWPNPAHKHPVTGKAGAPSLYFLRSLVSTWTTEGVEYKESRLLWELRQYRQKEGAPPDTPVKENDDVSDCLAYSYAVRPFVPGADTAPWGAPEAPTKHLDHMSQVATEQYEKSLKKLAKSGRTR